MDEIWKLFGQMIAALGGASVVVLGLSNYFGKIFADRFIETKKAELNAENERLKGELSREMETHRIRLRKSEVLFQMEINAASRLVEIRREMMPAFHVPDMDWEDALEGIALQFVELEPQLSEFIAQYGAILPDDVVDLLSACIGIAGRNKFEASVEYISSDASNAANELYEKTREAEASLLRQLRAQVER